MMINSEDERKYRAISEHFYNKTKRILSITPAQKMVDRIWTARKNQSGLKQPVNAKIIQVKGVDCYA